MGQINGSSKLTVNNFSVWLFYLEVVILTSKGLSLPFITSDHIVDVGRKKDGSLFVLFSQFSDRVVLSIPRFLDRSGG